jgi:NAD-dependent deacetylase
LDKVTLLHEQGLDVPLIDAPCEHVAEACEDLEDDKRLKTVLLDAFKISQATLKPDLNVSLKPFVLLFDEYYTDLYRMYEPETLSYQITLFGPISADVKQAQP